MTPEDSAEIKLHCTITFAGDDVIGGVQDMVETGIISYPPPDWVGAPIWDNFVFLPDILGSKLGHRRDKQVQVEGPD